MNESAFLQLFSDEAATPDPAFVKTLESRVLTLSQSAVIAKRLSLRAKLLILTGIILTIGIIIALVFLPRRDMRDATKDSVIESVVSSSQESASSFAPSTTELPTVEAPKAETPKITKQDTATNSSPTTTVPPVNTPVAISGFIAEYWNHDDPGNTSPTFPMSPPAYTSTVSDINFSWGLGSPHASIDSDAFLARYTKDAIIPMGTYKVVFANNDGLRMHVNETVVFDHWNDSIGSGVAYFTTDSSLPTTSILIEYHETTGPASISITITKQD